MHLECAERFALAHNGLYLFFFYVYARIRFSCDLRLKLASILNKLLVCTVYRPLLPQKPCTRPS